ncbi:glyoxal reductase [Propionigenium maris DSM 9537]|uniref:Glyoxal reductase n=1 Tax=Propionigenium maris DSM 9537 TaxID=1123000 RepID=A0A9W6GK91_9FUSO|nr:aldo/keto reductase [Propionigenium maris]GLI55296.1 glyoxal reductase [Propionigenium maris DSM 9537]
MEKVKLNNGVEIPIVGLGTFKAKGEEVYNSVRVALREGYRHIDTAAAYKNEEEVGRAIRDSGIPREEIFITTKLWNSDQGYESTKKALEVSLKNLGISYVDLYLIHWHKGVERARESWRAMEEAYHEGKIRAIGVSNFTMYHIEKLLETAEVVPVINQVETHVGLPQYDMQNYCESKGIKLTAYAPMQAGKIFDNEEMARIAQKHKKTVANIALRFLVERGIIVIPKSVHEERIIANKEIFDFTLDDEDREAMRGLWDGRRLFPDPDNCYF